MRTLGVTHHRNVVVSSNVARRVAGVAPEVGGRERARVDDQEGQYYYLQDEAGHLNSPRLVTRASTTAERWRSADGSWSANGPLLNGWQRIRRPDGNTTPAFGHQLTWTPD